MNLFYVICFVEILAIVAQKNPNFSNKRDVIIHLFEWKWSDIADECERFLQQKGYGGIQISPPNENIIAPTRPWWERYQPVSYTLKTRSGTESELSDMIKRCNKVGIRIYADIVINHMAALTGYGTAGNEALSDLKIYPAPKYNPEHFHPTCEIKTYLKPDVIRNCEVKHQRDLDQALPFVRDGIVEYLNNLIRLGVAGFRIDSAKYMWPENLQSIYEKLDDLNVAFGFSAKTRPFIYQDAPIYEYSEDVTSKTEYTPLGVVVEELYSKSLGRVFSGKLNLSTLNNWGPDWGFIPKSEDSLVFVDSHNTQRNPEILNYKSLKQYKMAVAFMLAHPYGIPRILSSFFFENSDVGPPQDSDENIKSPIIYSDESCGDGYVCEHRWPQIYNMVEFKQAVSGTSISNWWSNGNNQIAFTRGKSGFVAFNNGGTLSKQLRTMLPTGTYCDVVSGALVKGKCTGKTVTVDTSGYAQISIGENDFDGVMAIHLGSKSV